MLLRGLSRRLFGLDRQGCPSVPYIPADADGGFFIGRSCVDALGAWGPSATNKLRWVYTGALLAKQVKTLQ